MEGNEAAQPASEETRPGWYIYPDGGGRRFWDGRRWTDHFVYVPPGRGVEDFISRFLAVFLGVLAALIAFRYLADADPDTFFMPIKVVVDPDKIPSF
jgi:hypothetical protein